MWFFFIILIAVCIPSIILVLAPDKTEEWNKVDAKAELLCPIHDNSTSLRWLARYTCGEENYVYIIVRCSQEHQAGDIVEIGSVQDYMEYPIFDEPCSENQ